ncbi:MAG: cytochrome c [Deltaproteobacteria bacterium]|nr:cytochrome c [Deltaproteobacteria bacterium]
MRPAALALLAACSSGAPPPAPAQAPLPADPEVREVAPGPLRAGRVAFRATCQVCHGLYGQGDGPAAAALHPPPADLTEPTRADAWTPARLEDTIRSGVPGTAMIAFEDQMEASEILSVTAWVHTLPAGGT